MGPTESACTVQGYFDETDAGQCPEGTCQVLAFDTNGGRLACCTSVVSGPGSCADAGTATESGADAGD